MPGPVAAAPEPPPARTGGASSPLAAPALGGFLEALSDLRTGERPLSLPADGRRPLADILGLDMHDAEISQVGFVDTPDLQLLRQGVVVRARRTQDRPADLTVTLLWADPAALPPAIRQLPGFRVDVDTRPTGFACSCSLEAPVSDRTMEDALEGRLSPWHLLTAHQRRLVSLHAPDAADRTATDVPWLLGPIHVLSHRLAPDGLRRGLLAERWFLPDETRLVHLSSRCKPAKVLRTAGRLDAYLAANGVPPAPTSETTTRAALDALARGARPVTRGTIEAAPPTGRAPAPQSEAQSQAQSEAQPDPEPANTWRHGTAAGRSQP